MREIGVDQNVDNIEDRQIVLNRSFNAPRDLVWEVWTKPEHLVHWWGPTGFHITVQEYELRTGGVWRFVMHGPGGVDFPNQIVFREIVRPERLVYASSDGEEDSLGQFQTTVTFEEVGDTTAITMQMLFKSAEERNYVVKTYGAIEGGNQTLDRLAAHLASF
ncbi:SRPBCC family protein [Paenibacillus guangzhouensis]|uniref:SRPBCC family protein n=1 Tax=Paenibacillus guangzhouensis TaxID=1473112 RepID=UPI001266C972|nr:SRPBCC family protein [Paenibacillus guangzhouensis]